jgi:UDP-N-acetylmuramoyl-tripeptide--D-alanyl-D-alanine ligase
MAQGAAIGPKPLIAEQFANHMAVIARVKAMMQPGDRILFKASRAVGLDRVVETLLDSNLSVR